jgi:carnitine O-acetyltransferase
MTNFLVFSSSHLQQLPKVPVPLLEQTTSEYLKALKPIVTAQQYERTKNIIKQFSVHPGAKYYDYLSEKREAEDNWVS